jgi:hypothetical protein
MDTAYLKVKEIGTRQKLCEKVFLPRALLGSGLGLPLSLEGVCSRRASHDRATTSEGTLFHSGLLDHGKRFIDCLLELAEGLRQSKL